jgi:hypothetical protein
VFSLNAFPTVLLIQAGLIWSDGLASSVSLEFRHHLAMSDSCVVDLHPTIGTLEIGSFISVFLFGVVTVQTHMYYRRFPEDRRILKALVSNST